MKKTYFSHSPNFSMILMLGMSILKRLKTSDKFGFYIEPYKYSLSLWLRRCGSRRVEGSRKLTYLVRGARVYLLHVVTIHKMHGYCYLDMCKCKLCKCKDSCVASRSGPPRYQGEGSPQGFGVLCESLCSVSCCIYAEINRSVTLSQPLKRLYISNSFSNS